jgi:hypothetical protein
VRPKWFLKLWYVWYKLWIYLAPIQTQSPNRLKQDSIGASSPRSTIRCIQNNFLANGTYGANLSCTKTNTISKRTKRRLYMTHVTLKFHRCVQNDFLWLWYLWCKLWTYLALILTLCPNGPKRDSTRPTSPRSSIRCVQKDFLAYGMFGANRSPILNQDYHYLQTKRNELPFEPRHIGVPSGASKMISEPTVRSAQTVPLS